MPPHRIPLWPLPLLAGLLPVIATLIALGLSTHLALIPPCNPFFEGCTSVSRAARYGLSNYIFRAMVLPAAVLQGLTWLLCHAWLRQLGAPQTPWLRHLSWLGVTAAVFLVIYGAFLGTEGAVYQWLRRYGTIGYFGCTLLSMLIAADAIQRVAPARPALRRGRLDLALHLLVAVLVLAGQVNVFVAPMFDPQIEDRIEDAAEWWGATALCAVFVVLAWLWRRSGFAANLSSAR